MLKLSIQVKSEDWYWVLESSQKIDIKTQLDDQFKHDSDRDDVQVHWCYLSSFYMKNICIALFVNLQLMFLYNLYEIDNKIHLYMMLTTNLLILFYVWIEVRRVKRFQFNAVWMMLERCVIRKVIMQSFHSCNNISSNSHNQSTRKINDMSMSVKDEKILLVIRQFRCIVWELWLQVIEEMIIHWSSRYSEMSSSHRQCRWIIDEKISDRIVISNDEFENRDYMCSKK